MKLPKGKRKRNGYYVFGGSAYNGRKWWSSSPEKEWRSVGFIHKVTEKAAIRQLKRCPLEWRLALWRRGDWPMVDCLEFQRYGRWKRLRYAYLDRSGKVRYL